MATISETELQRRLRNLESGITGGSDSGTSVTAEQVDGSWEYIDPVIYLAYANDIFNLAADGVITNQSDAAGFQYSPFNSQGALLKWRGYLFSTSIYASGDATDYIWERVVTTEETSSVSFIRYYTVSANFQHNIGTPNDPADDVVWIEVSAADIIPAEAFWVADQFYLNGVLSSWQIYPVATRSLSAGVIAFKKEGFNKPELGDDVWAVDVLTAATVFTGDVFGSINELGYGTTVIIEYDDGKLSGTYKKTGWSPAEQFIDGDLIVTDTIAGDKINANSISAQHIIAGAIVADSLAADSVTADAILAGTITGTLIAADTITGTQIDASTLNVQDQNLTGLLSVSAGTGAISWGKTGVNDFTNTGLFIGNSGSNPMMNFGSTDRYFYYDGENDILFFTGQTTTGPATVGSTSTYNRSDHSLDNSGDPILITHNIPASVTSVKVSLVGSGASGSCCNNAITQAGEDTYIKRYNSSDVLQATYTGSGGSTNVNSCSGNIVWNYSWGAGRWYCNQNWGTQYFSGTTAWDNNIHTNGEDFSWNGWTGTGGAFGGSGNISGTPGSHPGDGSGVGSGGGSGTSASAGDPWWDSSRNFKPGGEAGSTYQATISVNTGDYLKVFIGEGGTGQVASTGYESWTSGSGDGAPGRASVEIISVS